jgi:hypothetical protein
MKNFFILIALFSVIFFSACSQKNPPESVKKEFSQKFADAKSVKWDSEEANEWEAEFKINGKEMSACFDNTGKWLETEAEVSDKELPSAVTNTLKSEFPGFKAGEASTIEDPEMKGFEIALKNKEKEIAVIIGSDGTVLKKESSDENKEEAVSEKNEKEENESDEAGEKKELKEKGEGEELKEADEKGELKEVSEKEELKVPEKFLTTFEQKFPGATEVKWGSESENEWEAEFTMNGKRMSASFDVSPVWICTETVITEKELPAVVLNTLNTKFAGFTKSLIEIYETPEIKGFEIGLKNGEKSVEVVIDNAGKMIEKAGVVKEENEKEEQEKEELK